MTRTNAPLPKPEAALPRRTVPPRAADAALDAVVRAPEGGGRPSGGPDDLFVAVVHTLDEVRLVAASPSREDLVRRVAEHARQHAADELWAEDAARVHALLAAGEPEAAIAHYFATVGQRWDAEWLVTAHAGALVDHVPAPRCSRATGGAVHLAPEHARRTAEPGRRGRPARRTTLTTREQPARP